MLKFSIITINLNNKSGLENTIKSVIGQDHKNFEFIVVDGASTDGSVDVIEKNKTNIEKTISEKDSGIYNAMNKGIKASKGEYLLFLNSGDYLVNEKVLSQAEPLLDGVEVVGGNMIKLVEGKEHLAESPEKITLEWFLDVSLHHQATFVKRSLFEKHGLYNEEYKLGGDYEFFVRTLLKENSTYKNIPLTVCYFPTDGISNRADWLEINMKEKERTWNLHFSKAVRNHINDYIKLKNSEEIKWGNRIVKRLGFLYR